jgi:hypothetical protein
MRRGAHQGGSKVASRQGRIVACMAPTSMTMNPLATSVRTQGLVYRRAATGATGGDGEEETAVWSRRSYCQPTGIGRGSTLPSPRAQEQQPHPTTTVPNQTKPGWQTLPPEAIGKIYSYLPPEDVGQGQNVCRSFRDALAQTGNTEAKLGLLGIGDATAAATGSSWALQTAMIPIQGDNR